MIDVPTVRCHVAPWPEPRHLGADGAQFGHDLAMHRADIAVIDRQAIGMSPTNELVRYENVCD